MPLFISVVGQSKSGKTTLIEKIIPELNQRGYRVGAAKHTPHGMDLDTEGKDSNRLWQAGAKTVIAAGNGQVVMFKDQQTKSHIDALAAIKPYFSDMNIVLVEGYKQAGLPKIEILSPTGDQSPHFRDDPTLLAVVADSAPSDPESAFFSTSDIPQLTDLIESRFLSENGRDNS